MKALVTVVLLVAVGAGCGPRVTAPQARMPDRVTPAAAGFTGRAEATSVGEAQSGKQDLDANGEQDCWRLMYSEGGGFMGFTLTVRPACAGAVRTLSTVAPMTHILTGLSLPLEWRRAPAMVTGALDFLYGLEHLRTWVRAEGSDTPRADASFRWLRDRHRRESLGSRVPFYSVYAYEPVWQPGKPELPESQLVVLDDPADRPLLEGLLARPGASGTVPAAEEGDPPYGLLIYQANLHGQLQPVGKCGRWELHSTGHAIAAYDPTGDSWSWVYVSAERIHLLLGSVLEVGCMGDVVVVEPFRAKGQREIWVVAPEIGRVGRIPVAGSDLWSFDRQRQQLRLGGGIWSIDDLHEKLANPAP